MKVNTFMPGSLKFYFRKEIEAFRNQLKANDIVSAWHHLERAHVLGQAYPIEHTYTHWQMLKFGFHIKNSREIIGQLPRLLVGGVKSFVGKIPVGNTGGADVPPLRPLPIDEDLQQIFINCGVSN